MATIDSSSKKRPFAGITAEGGLCDGNAMIDSLPYVDAVHEDYEQFALALIEDEMKSTKPPPQDDALPPMKFLAPLMKHEHDRLVAASSSNGGKLPPRDFKDLEASTARPDVDDDVDAWRNALRGARTEYEAERARSIALNVKRDAGTSLLWKGFNGTLDKDLAAMRQALAREREIVDQINLQRSEDQQKAGKELHILTTKYQSALERRFQLQQATAALEKEVELLSSSQ